MMKFMFQTIIPIGLYALAFSLMDMSFGKELIVGLLLIAGAHSSALSREWF